MIFLINTGQVNIAKIVRGRRMSIERRDERSGDTYVAICDICGEELPAETDWQAAVDAKLDACWLSRYFNREWQDLCCECRRGA